jgi:hypothetical protein
MFVFRDFSLVEKVLDMPEESSLQALTESDAQKLQHNT